MPSSLLLLRLRLVLPLLPLLGPLEAMMVKVAFVALSLLLSSLRGQALEDLKPTTCEYQSELILIFSVQRSCSTTFYASDLFI